VSAARLGSGSSRRWPSSATSRGRAALSDGAPTQARDRLRRDRDRRLQVGVRDRNRPRRPARDGDDPDDDTCGDDQPGDRVLRARGTGRSARSTRSSPRRPGARSRPPRSRAGLIPMSARRSADACRSRWHSTRTPTPPRSASTAGERLRASTPSATSRSAPASAAAEWHAASSSTASCTPSSATCASHTTGRRTRSPASALTGDCWEGLASGRSIEARWRRPPEELAAEEAVWELEARYLAVGVVSVICVLSPERVVLGGGVMRQPALLPLLTCGHSPVGLWSSRARCGRGPPDPRR
jgi:hypothetical protein